MRNTLLLLLALVMASLTFAQPSPATFSNPILPGFNADPSICRVGDTYYMTHSTFEYFPALPILKSKDLVNWEKIGHAIHRPDQVNLPDGLDNSNGMFAPSIRYHDGTFYVICTCVGCGGNFIVTATDPAGPWSDPRWIKGAVGIDPTLFWEDDGRCYYLGAGHVTGGKKEWPGQNGVYMQEIDLTQGKLLGEPIQLTHGHAANARWTEGPRLFKIDGEYLLMAAEGGTSEYHAVTVFNSKNLLGPYIPNHANPVMTHRHLGYTHPFIQTGHSDLVQTQEGDWWSVLHAKRPIEGYSLLCRETFLAKVEMVQQESG
ncbi:MAG: glycoside hydrolase family 43 protein, partial [Bacteroidota bacterium]